jgi:hypothetical protein
VGIPGPSAAPWAIALLAWAVLAAILGELVRVVAARFVSLWRHPEPIERILLDFYLGGALLFVVATIPWSAFSGPVVFVLPIVAWVALGVLWTRSSLRPGWSRHVRSYLALLVRPVYLLVLVSAAGLFAVELATATPIGTGNTFDSSLLTLYTSSLLQHHSTPFSFAPYAPTGLLYPQGTTVWLGWAQLLLGSPPARTALLVTPLFFAMAPLAGFVFGRRVFGSDRAGLATALLLAWVGPGSRAIVVGSNDFVFAFPLVLLLAGEAVVWLRAPNPRFSDALGFGLLTGYSAALNPVGAEWLLLALPVAALLSQPRFGGTVRGWFARWAVAVTAAIVGVVPQLYVLALERSSPGFFAGANAPAPGGSGGISSAQFIGAIDPFLFGSSDTGLSPLAALRLELAILVVLGLALLLLVGRDSSLGRYFERFRPLIAGAVAATVGLLAVLWAASTGFAPAVAFARISSESELSWWLFALYGLIATGPLVLALERFVGWVRRTTPPSPVRRPPPATRRPTGRSPSISRALLPLAVALVIVVPGVVLTPTELPTSLSGQYHDFGNVTAADFALLSFSGSYLPAGSRVLVAPGSAGQFLPGYCPNIVLLYPMIPGWRSVNASYELLVRDLPNGTLDVADTQAIATLAVEYIVVTGNSTTLWPAFSPRPFLADPGGYALIFVEGDAYLFGVRT